MAKVKVLTATREDNMLVLSWFVGTDKVLWNKILDKVKLLTGRYFDGDIKKWKCPDSPHNVELLGRWRFRIKQGKTKVVEREKVIPKIDESYKSIELTNVDDRLRGYQYEGVQFLKQHNYRALVADPCGSGKSLHAVSCVREGNLFPAMFIVPATLKLNWQREFDMWMPKNHKKKILIIEGRAQVNVKGYDVLICNYDIIYYHVENIIKNFKPLFIAADEFHVCKSDSTYVSKYYPDYNLKENEEIHSSADGARSIHKKAPKRVQAVRVLVGGLSEQQKISSGINWDGVKHFLPMSATFILNHPGDVFNVLNLLDPQKFTSRDKFEDYFCVKESGYTKGSMKITGGKNLDVLNKILVENYMLRRDKSIILPDVPPIINVVIPLQMEESSAIQYRQIEEDFLSFIEGNEEIPPKARNDRFRLLLNTAVEGKFKQGLAFVDSLLEVPKEKVVIFCHHKVIVEKLYQHYGKKAVKLNGECSLTEKQSAVDKFMKDPKITVFIGNIAASSVGITLTSSNKCVFFETGYSSALVLQASSRTARIGQDRDTCLSYFLTAQDTIEQFIFEKLDRKQQIADKTLDGIETASDDLLGELWKEFKKRLDKR